MKKLIILGLVLLTGLNVLQAYDYTYFPTATTDDFLATKVNPAALAFGNASGVGYVHSFQDKMMQKNWENLYAYLKGRSDGKINPGDLQAIDAK